MQWIASDEEHSARAREAHFLARVETAPSGKYFPLGFAAFPRARGNRLYKNFVWFNQAFREQYARARDMPLLAQGFVPEFLESIRARGAQPREGNISHSDESSIRARGAQPVETGGKTLSTCVHTRARGATTGRESMEIFPYLRTKARGAHRCYQMLWFHQAFIEQCARARDALLWSPRILTRYLPARPRGEHPPLLGDGSGTSISAMRPDQITLRRCAPSSRWCPPRRAALSKT